MREKCAKNVHLCNYKFHLLSQDSPEFSDCRPNHSMNKLVVDERVDTFSYFFSSD